MVQIARVEFAFEYPDEMEYEEIKERITEDIGERITSPDSYYIEPIMSYVSDKPATHAILTYPVTVALDKNLTVRELLGDDVLYGDGVEVYDDADMEFVERIADLKIHQLNDEELKLVAGAVLTTKGYLDEGYQLDLEKLDIVRR